ncbi:type II toxin-antitoxin system VapC family toxin [Fibrisoma montanum]|uniref:Type II toxin-antitoxin system VapC family toxin n=1 Tax=Fibrisoma montanum TaxID=2305895 RepID=A0A418MBY8_9BACT|nr:PIN domain-containing protein [Fibrisoma montanum]RIV23885.1 type II toxin-antitoxin system VapC family toxin [Fibrisoma montanum]
MMHLLDTNIVLAYLKKSTLSVALDKQYGLLSEHAKPFISAVTVGELWSLCLQNNWGPKRRELLIEILRQLTIVDINLEPIIQNYAEIDAFSQSKLMGRPLGSSARNMGKNDLWIAATASMLDAVLITTDKDFDHLHGQFVEVIRIDPDVYR